VIVDWAARSLTESPRETEAELQANEQGLQVTTYERRGPVHVVWREELLDEFEITCRIVQPSVEELRAEGMVHPSPFASLVGFRSVDGRLNMRNHLKRDRQVRETFDVVLRGSQQKLRFTINGERQQVVPRHRLEPGHFFLELSKNSRAYISNIAVRKGLEPDPLLAAAGRTQTAPTGDGPAPPPFSFGPVPPGPGFSGMIPHDSGAPPPPPSRLEPLVTRGDWSVRKIGNQNLDTAIAQDLRLESSDDGLVVAKTGASGGFWLIRAIDHPGDFTASCCVSVPSMGELASTADPTTLLAVGIYPTDTNQPGVIAAAPPPLPTSAREVKIALRRSNGRVTLDVAGRPVGGSVTAVGEVLLGLYVRGSIRFSIRELTITPSVSEAAAGEPAVKPPSAVSPTVPEMLPKPPAKRVWTDASGTKQVEATFTRLEAGKVFLLRQQDGKEVAIHLDGLSRDDQDIVRRLAEP
jgi:hypothetical protein